MRWRRILAIGATDIRIVSRDPLPPVSLFFITPLLLIAFVRPIYGPVLAARGIPGADGADQAVPGLAVMFTLFALSYCGFFYFREHGLQTWDRLRNHATGPELVVGKLIAPLLLLLTQQFVILGIGGTVFGLQVHGPILWAFVVSIAFCVTTVILSVALVGLCKSIMQLNARSQLDRVDRRRTGRRDRCRSPCCPNGLGTSHRPCPRIGP